MNIIIKNQNSIMDSFQKDVVKTLTGEFTYDEIQQEISSVFYNKAIIDITAIKDYQNNLIDFLRVFDLLKIIIVFKPGELSKYNKTVGKLIEHGYYNLAKDVSGIEDLINNPNNYEDVEQYVSGNDISALNPTNIDL